LAGSAAAALPFVAVAARAATKRHLAEYLGHCYLKVMLKFEGAALLGEVIATAWLVIALIGFSIRRSTPWLICAAFGAMMLLTTVIMITDASA
jgi:hypothetical protein